MNFTVILLVIFSLFTNMRNVYSQTMENSLEKLVLEIQLEKPIILKGEPIAFSVKLTNNDKEGFYVCKLLPPEGWLIAFTIFDENNKIVYQSPVVKVKRKTKNIKDFVFLEPGEFYGKKYSFSKIKLLKGEYFIEAGYRNNSYLEANNMVAISGYWKSKRISFQIVDEDS